MAPMALMLLLLLRRNCDLATEWLLIADHFLATPRRMRGNWLQQLRYDLCLSVTADFILIQGDLRSKRVAYN
jgi:hypothetical protein